MTPSHNATQASRHAAKFNGSQVDMLEVSSREWSCKHSQTIRRASTSRARNLVQRPSWPIKDPFRAVLSARRHVRRPSWTPGGSSKGRLERQEARPKAVLNARRLVRRSSWPSSRCQNAGLTAVLLQNAFFCAVRGVSSERKRARPNCIIVVKTLGAVPRNFACGGPPYRRRRRDQLRIFLGGSMELRMRWAAPPPPIGRSDPPRMTCVFSGGCCHDETVSRRVHNPAEHGGFRQELALCFIWRPSTLYSRRRRNPWMLPLRLQTHSVGLRPCAGVCVGLGYLIAELLKAKSPMGGYRNGG